ncbi:hypothetical protein F5Y17DRAFT_457340 [Xylariaceae sp. FL0594]|nr:hypothetical protein F5Y17DRAFT_457340 [Xylariaceae sp. FL0594]
MFISERQAILDTGFWRPDRGGIAYFDAWRPSPDSRNDGHREGRIGDKDVADWLYRRDRFGSPSPGPSIRLLFCDRVGWKPLGFALSVESYLALEDVFGLGDQVLSLISKNAGQQMCRLGYSSSGALENVEFTVKWPQLYQIGNCGLAFKHEFSTGTTHGFLHGWDMVTPTDQVPLRNAYRLFTDAVRGHFVAPSGEGSSSSPPPSTMSLLSHPLFMPVVMLSEHVRRAQEYSDELVRRMAFLEHELGVTRVGQSSWQTTKQFAAIQRLISSRADRVGLTAELNSRVTDATNFGTVLDWIVRHAGFLEKYKDVVQALRPHPDPREHRQVEELLEYVADDAVTLKVHVEALKTRFELQLSVLYNFVAQVDNDLNMRIAYRAGLDGTAMKTLAYVTTVFLPPTFIASLFSMSMFDWQASVPSSSSSSSDGSVVVVPDFWIYWVISVPLTLAILAGWRVWLRREKDALLAEYGIPHLDSVSNQNRGEGKQPPEGQPRQMAMMSGETKIGRRSWGGLGRGDGTQI